VESGEFVTAEEVVARLNQLPADYRAAKEKEIARRGRLRIVKNGDDK
jgi:predicted deacylase